jgi:hypothetical protein
MLTFSIYSKSNSLFFIQQSLDFHLYTFKKTLPSRTILQVDRHKCTRVILIALYLISHKNKT